MCCPLTGPEEQGQLLVDWELWTCEAKWTFPLHDMMPWGILL